MELGKVRTYAGATGADLHIDAPLSNISIGFRPKGLIARDVYPLVQVPKQSDAYYVWSRAEWLRTPSTQRAKGTEARKIQLKVSSETFYCLNYALRCDLPYEDISNADAAIALRESGANRVVDGLEQDWEQRLATTLTTTTNVGSAFDLTAAGLFRWDDHVNGAPVEDLFIGIRAIQGVTGYRPNKLILSGLAAARFLRHPDVIKYIRGAGDNIGGGSVTEEQVKNAFRLDQVLIGEGVRNTAGEDAPGTYIDVWSTSAILLYVAPSPGLMEPSHGYTFWWQPEGFPGRFGTERRRDDNKKVEIVETHTFQDEQVTSTALGFLIVGA